MIHKSRGIVLNQYKYGDSSIIVHIYTEKFGRQSYIIKGAHSRKSKKKSNLLRPFFLLDMEAYHREGKELQNLKEIKLSDPLINLPYDILKSTQALFLAEVLCKALREEEPNPGLFEFLYHSIQYLDASREPVINFHLFFLVHLSRFLGFFPQLNYAVDRPIFDLANGSFITNTEPGSHYLTRELSEILNTFLKTSIENIGTLKISNKNRNNLLDALLGYYALHLDGFSTVKSLSVLREVFN